MTEQQAYEVVRTYEDFELRRYAPHVVAEVVVRGAFEDAGNTAFRTLFRYISGTNASGTKVAMTAPVIQRDAEQMPGTTPPEPREADSGEQAVAFVLPATVTLDGAPVPTSPDVRLRQRPEVLAAACRYRGRWTEALFDEHRRELTRAVTAAGLTPVGSARWARFDPPYKPWFLRRNEIVLDVADVPSPP